MTDEADWRSVAVEAYRAGWSALERWKHHPDTTVQFVLEDLKEALLDLKQATIADDEPGMWLHVDEVQMLLIELADLAGGSHA